MSAVARAVLLGLLLSAGGVAAVQRGHEQGHEHVQGLGQDKGHGNLISISKEKGQGNLISNHTGQQAPEELGFTSDGDVDQGTHEISKMAKDHCLDLGAKGFPLPVFQMMQAVDWDAQKYLEQIQAKGYAEDALQMTGPQEAIMKSDCMKASAKGKVKHIFVGDSQMMSLRNAFHRLNKCPEIWWDKAGNATALQLQRRSVGESSGRLHSLTQQAPEGSLNACREEGIASFIYWDAWAKRKLPVDEIKREMEALSLDPKDGDTVVLWAGSNFIPAERRMGVLTDTIDQSHMLGVKLIWDSPTYQDTAMMAATSPMDQGRDMSNRIPITYNSISLRKDRGTIGSNQYKSEKVLFESGIEIPMTKRWQLTNRYRGLQCDGMHTDMRARDPLFYNMECVGGKQRYGVSSHGCNWVEAFKTELNDICPVAYGLDDLVLQSGLYSACAAHERPLCYQHTESIR